MTKKKSREFVSCIARRCRANDNGKCVALADNHFGKRMCPFYKKREFDGDNSWENLRRE